MHSVQSVVFALLIKTDITVMTLHGTEVITDDLSLHFHACCSQPYGKMRWWQRVGFSQAFSKHRSV